MSAVLPLALAFIMFYLGLTLRGQDFWHLLRRPRALGVGLLGQVLMVPLLGLLVARTGGLEPTMAVGLMVLVACPGGISSGLLTHLARGDVALSIGLTAVTSLLAMLTLPLVLDASLSLFASELSGAGPQRAPLALADTARRMFLLTTLPVLAGMALRAWQAPRVLRWLPGLARVATALFVLIVAATFWEQRHVLLEHLPTVGPACALLNGLILALSWSGSRLAGLSHADAIAVTTECGLQNSALGIYVCVELLRAPAMSVPSVVYALLMNLGALVFIVLMRPARHGDRRQGWAG
jgi:bile acid:Na+ symporter, BASS family